MFVICVLVVMLSAMLVVGRAAEASSLQIVKSRKANATIVLGHDAIASERFAAKQLCDCIKQISGAELPVTDTAPAHGIRIYIGQTAAVRKLLPGFDWNTLKYDGILLRSIGSDIVLSGDRPRGSIYAVQELLENQLGVRWYAADETHIPKLANISISSLNTCYTPKLMYREAYFHNVMQEDGTFPVHLRMNGNHQQIKSEMGGHFAILGFVHTMSQLLQPDNYFGSHPEWYALRDGKRVPDAQLCLSNAEMRKQMVVRALEWIKQEPDAGIISISQNDNLCYCQCEQCKQLVKQTGSQSGALISFVNEVAAEIEKHYPDYLVETLAYQYTRHAPKKVKPRDNVIIRLCSIECNFGQPMTHKDNASFYKDMVDWGKIAKRLYIWNYVVNFSSYLIPHPNFEYLGDDLRTFTKNNVIGMFEQGDFFNRDCTMYPLKIYLLAKLMWNPELRDIDVMKDFMDGYYGPAGKQLLKAVLLMEAARKRSKIWLGCYVGLPTWYSCDELIALKRLYDQAYSSVQHNPKLAERVNIQRLALDHALILSKRYHAAKGCEVPGVKWSGIVDNFCKLSNSSGNNWICEQGRWEAHYETYLKSMITYGLDGNYAKIPTAVHGVKDTDWIDVQEPQIQYENEGLWVMVVADKESSNGYASEMPSIHDHWSMFYKLGKKELGWKTIDVSVDVKVVYAEGKAPNPQDVILNFGVENNDPAVENAKLAITAAQCPQGYHHFEIRSVAVKPEMMIYAGPTENSNIKAVRIDRIVIQPSK